MYARSAIVGSAFLISPLSGKQEENTSFYYFDSENFVPIVVHSEIRSGQGKGLTQEIKLSDYQEVDGLYFPFSMTQGIKDRDAGQPIALTKIELNPTVDLKEFTFPEETPEPVTDNKN